MHKLNVIQTFTVIGILFTVIGCGSGTSANKQEETPAPVPASSLPVDVTIAKKLQLNEVETIAGSIVPNRTVDIMSELSRKVTQVYFKDGSSVNRGQLLYKLDDADILARISQVKAELNLARISENRLKELLKTETVRQEEYDIALSKLQSLEAAMNIVQVELSKTVIHAPFDGIVGISKVFKGTLVSPGMPMVTLVERANTKIEFTVPEKYISLVKNGKRIRFQTETSTKPIHAIITSTEANLNESSRTIKVLALIESNKEDIRAGMSAKIFFTTSDEQEKAILIPTEALIPGGTGYNVFLVKEGKTKLSPVKIENRTDQEVRITDGIAEGDTVMISNMLRAGDNMPVSIAGIK